MSFRFLNRQPVSVQVIFLCVLAAAYITAYALLLPSLGTVAALLPSPLLGVIAWQLAGFATALFGLGVAAGLVISTWLTAGSQVAVSLATFLPVAGVILIAGMLGAMGYLNRARERSDWLLLQQREIADDGAWDWHITESRVDYAPRWFTMLGYRPAEFPGHYDTFAGLLHPDDLERVEHLVGKVVEGPEDQFQTDCRLLGKDGTYRSVLSRGKVTERDRAGRAVRMIGVHLDITAQKRVEEETIFFAYHNQLTGLPNRKSFYERLSETIKVAMRSETDNHRGLIALDIDDFKAVNDMHGQQMADQVIVAFAERLRLSIRDSDYLFHLSGDDFCIVLNNLADDADVGVVADKIRRKSEEPLVIGDRSISVRSSMGLAIFPRDGSDATSLASSAETALVEAKHERNTYRFYTEEMHTRIVQRVRLIDELRQSIREERFTVHYQPIVDAHANLVAAEALVRWNHPTAGLRGPDAFVDVAEETGLIVDIGEQVIGRVCADIRKMLDLGHRLVPISVNLSVKQLSSKAVVGQIQRALSFHRVPDRMLALEITESSIMENMGATLSTIEALILLGMQFSIDDFGTGYSSLAYLKRLPIHTVKIDRSFVNELPHSTKDAAIIRSVIAMSEGLGLGLVAEGVETKAQESFLRSAGCPRMQGFLYSMPIPRQKLEQLLAERTIGLVSRGSTRPAQSIAL